MEERIKKNCLHSSNGSISWDKQLTRGEAGNKTELEGLHDHGSAKWLLCLANEVWGRAQWDDDIEKIN